MANVYVNHDVNAAFAVAASLVADVDVRILIESFECVVWQKKRIKNPYFSNFSYATERRRENNE